MDLGGGPQGDAGGLLDGSDRLLGRGAIRCPQNRTQLLIGDDWLLCQVESVCWGGGETEKDMKSEEMEPSEEEGGQRGSVQLGALGVGKMWPMVLLQGLSAHNVTLPMQAVT